ncbi:MAG: hypothetical protein AB8B55_06930, partial [Mariniblastus sp.]
MNVRLYKGDPVKFGSSSISYTLNDSSTLGQRLAYVTVGSRTATGTGSYKVSMTPIDSAAGDTSTKSNFEFSGNVINIRDSIATEGDRDFHRVQLEAETWYRFTQTGADVYRVTAPNGSVSGFGSVNNPTKEAFYYASQSGDHYISFQAGFMSGGDPNVSTGSYEFEIARGYQPKVFSGAFSWPNPARNQFTGQPGNINDPTRLSGTNVEVYSNVGLTYQDGSNTR